MRVVGQWQANKDLKIMPLFDDSKDRETGDQKEKSEPKSRSQSQRSQSQHRGKSSASRLGKRANSIGSLGMIPVLLAVGPIIGIFIGQWLDKKFDSSPWLTILFVIMGFVAGVREMILLLKRENAKEARDSREHNDQRKHSDEDTSN